MPPTHSEDPQIGETYLCVISEWQGGRNSGNCYPIFVLSKGKVLTDPETQFPNAGAIFLPSRPGKAYDFISVKPVPNRTYTNQSYRDCYFVPLPSWIHSPERDETAGVYSILTVPYLDAESRRIDSPLQMVTPVFFVRDRSLNSRLVGPLRLDEVRRSSLGESIESIGWKADSADGLAWTFPISALEANKLRIEVYSHPNPELNEILHRPYEFLLGKLDGQLEGGEPVDLAAPEDLVHFFVKTAAIEVPPDILSALETVPTRVGTDAPAYLRSRYDRLARLLRSTRELEEERRRIAREFLDTEEGKRQIHAEITSAKAVARAEVQADIESERQRAQSQLSELETRKSALTKDLELERQRYAKELESLRRLREELSNALEASSADLEKRVFEELPGLVALSGFLSRSAPRGTSAEPRDETRAAPPAPEVEPPSPRRPFRPVEDEALYVRWLRDELAQLGLYFSLEMVTNIFVCLKCSPLNLIGGPPGVGKSSLVRTLPFLLGQEHCFLEMSIRRTWADDRALLGFPDVFHRRYEPGTTGFVPHLVKAMRDLSSSLGGIYIVLLDEFNLAPPEYYFSEFLRVLQKNPDERTLRLYTPAPGMEHDPIPSEVTVGPNVSFWGTVNLDETTEALSPRLLDRVQFVIISAEDIERPPGQAPDRPFTRLSERKPSPRAPLGPYGYAELAQSRLRDDQPNPEAKQLVDQALALLRDGRQEWGTPAAFYPRQLREIDRYLGASRPVLTATAAADLVLNQRVLPSLRGRGDAFRRRIEELQRALRGASLRRSACRLERILAHAEENYQAFDFHVY